MIMAYEGVKFKTEMIGNDLPDDPRLDRLKYWCRVFHNENLAPPYDGGSYGNLSFSARVRKNPAWLSAAKPAENCGINSRAA